MLRKLIVGLVAIALLGIAGIWLSARLSLDSELRHTRATALLPLLEEQGGDGLFRLRARGLVFRARLAGRENDGPGLVLLHGFPETSIMWTPLLDAAAQAGFRVVAFDQRGYSPGARPEGVEAYRIPELVADVMAVADAVGFERFHLIGHDWGAVVGWVVTGEHPERVTSWAALSIPHPGALAEQRGERGAPAYVRIFRAAGETLLSAGGMSGLRNLNPSLPPEQLAEYLAVFREPGALTGALNWYRATEWTPDSGLEPREVTRPALWLYGSREMDVFVNPDVRELQRGMVRGPFEVRELDAGHWLIHEQTEQVLMAHLARAGNQDERAARSIDLSEATGPLRAAGAPA